MCLCSVIMASCCDMLLYVASFLLFPHDQKLSKYKRMQKMNMPTQSVINRMRQDGMSPALIGRLYPDAPEAKGGIVWIFIIFDDN